VGVVEEVVDASDEVAFEAAAELLGFVAPAVSANGLLKATGALPSNANDFNRILITRETSHRPTAPGPIILEGELTGI
jgi:hypothetical protein